VSKVLERGNIYFFYRPRKEEPSPTGWEELQRAYVILSPDDGNKHRLITIGHKKPPEIIPGKAAGEERVWGFVDAVSTRPEDLEDKLEAPVPKRPTSERVRRLPRPAGEGRYALVEHEDHTHLAYALELPERPSPLGLEEKPRYPKELLDLFRGRKFVPVSSPNLLDFENAEIVMIGASEDAEQELGIRLDTEKETGNTADIFRELKLERQKHPVAPLFKCEWR